MPSSDLSTSVADPKVVQALNNLYEAERLIENSAFELADKSPSELIGRLITVAGELDRAIQDIVLYSMPAA